jgi:type II secretory pathway component PulJ
MTLFYVLILTFMLLVAYAGYDATMRLIQLMDLQIRYAWIRVQMKWMERKLKRKLLEDTANYQQLLKEHKEHDL